MDRGRAREASGPGEAFALAYFSFSSCCWLPILCSCRTTHRPKIAVRVITPSAPFRARGRLPFYLAPSRDVSTDLNQATDLEQETIDVAAREAPTVLEMQSNRRRPELRIKEDKRSTDKFNAPCMFEKSNVMLTIPTNRESRSAALGRMNRLAIQCIFTLLTASAWLGSMQSLGFAATTSPSDKRMTLPKPNTTGTMSVEEALQRRRSVRAFDAQALTREVLSQLLWAAQGVTSPTGYRAAPSAGALYPLSIYVVVGNVASLAPGIYNYDPAAHTISALQTGDRRAEIGAAALGQEWLRQAPVLLIVAGLFRRTIRKYGERGNRYVQIEAGHVSQNVYLQATALNLGTTVVGAFRDDRLRAVLGLPDDEDPICILPVGTALRGPTMTVPC